MKTRLAGLFTQRAARRVTLDQAYEMAVDDAIEETITGALGEDCIDSEYAEAWRVQDEARGNTVTAGESVELIIG